MNNGNLPHAPDVELSDVGAENVGRLLEASYRPEDPDPEFARALTARLCAAARGATAPSSAPAPSSERWHGVRRRLGWAMALAASVAVAALIVYASHRRAGIPENDGAQHDDSDGQPTVQHAAFPVGPGLTPRPRPAAPPVHPVAVGESLTTRAGERRRVALADGSVLYLNQDTRVTQVAARQLTLDRGEIYVEVAPRERTARIATFVVKTARREVAALGTRFAVSAGPEGTGVVVTQGKVQVSGLADPVRAGQQITPDGARASAAPRASHQLDWTRELMAAAESPLVPCSAHAGGALIALDPSGQEIKLSLRKYHIDVHIEDGFARTTIDQTYFNNVNDRLEGTFYFPLPPDASLSRLAMYVEANGVAQLMEGGMAEANLARNAYETIRYARRDPALLEWVDGSTFKMRVFPLEGRKEKRILLSYSQRLPSLYGVSRYRFPGGHNMDLVREWSFAARVKNAADLRCSSPTHPRLAAARQGGDLVLSLKEHAVKPDRDVALEIVDAGKAARAEEAARFSGFTHEGNRYLMVRYRPKLAGAPQRERRDWVFLFESAANRDPLLARAQIDIVRTLLSNAEHDDTFQILTAGTRTRLFDKQARPATAANIDAAVKFLEATHLIGALDLGGALKAAAPLLKAGKNPYLVHVGGGAAAMGERREDALAKLLPDGVRYVGVGVGKRWGRAFMKAAADRTGGHFTQINPDEPIAWRAFELLSTLNTPRLLELRVVDDAERVSFLCDAASLAQGEEVCAIARIPATGALPDAVSIAGKLDGKAFVRRLPVQDVADGAGYLPRTWARLEIERLLAEDGAKHKNTIVELSKAMYVMSPYTSLLVLETEADYVRFNVDRGRKDHWAMYRCEAKMPIVHEPHGSPAAPAAAPAGKKQPARNVLASLLVRVTPRFLTTASRGANGTVPAVTALDVYRGAYALPESPEEFGAEIGLQSPILFQRQSAQGKMTSLDGYLVAFLKRKDGKKGAEEDFKRIPFSGDAGLDFTTNGRLNLSGQGWYMGDGSLRGLSWKDLPSWEERLLDNRDDQAEVQREVARLSRKFELRQTEFAMRIKGIENLRQKIKDGSVVNLTVLRGQNLLKQLEDRDQTVTERTHSRPVDPLASLDTTEGRRHLLRIHDQPLVGLKIVIKDTKQRMPKELYDLIALKELPALSTAWQETDVLRLLQGSPPRSFLYERPSFTADPRVFGDLLTYAPGMNTGRADSNAVLEAEADLGDEVRTGTIDAAARAAIEKARGAGWQAVTLPGAGKQPGTRVVFNGQGHYAIERTLTNGLREVVVCDGKKLLHLYPDLFVGARRVVSRFHRAEFTDLVPWALPPAEELARGADLKCLNEHTVAVVPLGAEKRRDAQGKPQPYVQLRLVFAEGRLTERRVVLMPAGKVLSRETYAADGTLKLYWGEGDKASAEERFNRTAAKAPDLTPDTRKLVLVPMPLRTRAAVFASPSASSQWSAYDRWEEDDAIALIAADGAEQNSAEALNVFVARFHAKGDRRLGFYTLLTVSGAAIDPAHEVAWGNARGTPNIVFEHPREPLALYLAYHHHVLKHGQRTELGDIGGPADGFVQRLARFRELWGKWRHGPIGQGTRPASAAERDEALAYVKNAPSSLFAWAVLDEVEARPTGFDPTFREALASARRTAGDAVGLRYAGRYEQARALLHAGQREKALGLFRQLHAETVKAGVVPPIDATFRDTLQAADGPGAFAGLMRKAAAALAKTDGAGSVVPLGWQAHQLNDRPLAEELFAATVAAAPKGDGRHLVALANVAYLIHSNFARADAQLTLLLRDEKLSRSPMLWRLGASLATKRGLAGRAVLCLEKALDLEYRGLPEVVNLEAVRADYGALLTQYQQLASAITMLEGNASKEFLAKVVRAADRWRSLDADGTAACQAAGRILRVIGAKDLAWDYLTTPIALKPNESAPWLAVAQSLREEGEFDLADRAYATAFDAESTNAQILWDRAQNLQQAGLAEEARRVYRQLAAGTWQERFQGLKNQARFQADPR